MGITTQTCNENVSLKILRAFFGHCFPQLAVYLEKIHVNIRAIVGGKDQLF